MKAYLYRGRAKYALGVTALCLSVLVSAQTPIDYRRPPATDWPVVGGDWGNTRYSPLGTINRTNVKNLKGAWMTRLNSGFGPGFSQQATPVVIDGMLFITTGAQDVFALDARTGQFLWEYRPNTARKIGNKRGVTAAEGLVFTTEGDVEPDANGKSPEGGGRGAAAGTPVTRLVALDQKTGKVRWKQDIGKEVPRWAGAYASAPPLYYDGMIFMGLSGGDRALRGRVTAHDAKTGSELWRFYTVPGPGEIGHDTWEGDSWKTGGAAVWTQPALDPDLGLIYINTGNPWPAYNGSWRGGDNLFSASVVALDAKTGRYRWHYQTSRHDLWDFDVPTPLLLFDQMYDGQPRKGIAAHTKQGWVYILDRVTGKPLTPIVDTAVPQDKRQKTAAAQPIPAGDPTAPQCAESLKGFRRGCMWGPFWTEANVAQPSAAGDWAPGAYDPETGYLYFTTGVSTRVFRVDPERPVVNGVARGTSGGSRYGPIGTREYGLMTALDSRTNRKVWQIELPYLAGFGSGVLATRGGLLFHGGSDGNLYAFDSRTGERLWQFQTGFGADAPAVTYAIDGEQYVAIASGGGVESANEARGDVVWAFKLGGRLNPLNAPPPPVQRLSWDTPPRPSDQGSGRAVLVETKTIVIGRMWDVAAKRPGAKNEYAFGPVRTVVPVGTEVTFVNEGEMPHTATDQGGTWDSGVLDPGQKITLKFDKPGDYTYFCIPHPWMLGQLVVK